MAPVLAQAQAAEKRPPITGISHISVYTSDSAKADDFYVHDLGGVKRSDPENANGVRYYFSPTQFVEVLPLPGPPPACITSTSAAWITGCIGNTDAPPEANGFMKLAGRRRERTSVIAACQDGKLVAPLTFVGLATPKWWTRILRKCSCRCCRRAA